MKHVVQIGEEQLPRPFKAYWHSTKRLKRDYLFFDVDGELYILDSPEGWLMHHWTQDSCAGIQCYMQERGIEEKELPLVARDGQDTFKVIYKSSYETSIRHPMTGEIAILHYFWRLWHGELKGFSPGGSDARS